LQWSEVLSVDTQVIPPGVCRPVCLLNRAQTTCLHIGWGNLWLIVLYGTNCPHSCSLVLISSDNSRKLDVLERLVLLACVLVNSLLSQAFRDLCCKSVHSVKFAV